MMICGDTKRKTQKNGNCHARTYYRCSRKHKFIQCNDPAVREKDLFPQFSAILTDYSIITEINDYLCGKMNEAETAESSHNLSVSEKLREQIANLTAK
jgi:hypothetical protein